MNALSKKIVLLFPHLISKTFARVVSAYYLMPNLLFILIPPKQVGYRPRGNNIGECTLAHRRFFSQIENLKLLSIASTLWYQAQV